MNSSQYKQVFDARSTIKRMYADYAKLGEHEFRFDCSLYTNEQTLMIHKMLREWDKIDVVEHWNSIIRPRSITYLEIRVSMDDIIQGYIDTELHEQEPPDENPENLKMTARMTDEAIRMIDREYKRCLRENKDGFNYDLKNYSSEVAGIVCQKLEERNFRIEKFLDISDRIESVNIYVDEHDKRVYKNRKKVTPLNSMKRRI